MPLTGGGGRSGMGVYGSLCHYWRPIFQLSYCRCCESFRLSLVTAPCVKEDCLQGLYSVLASWVAFACLIAAGSPLSTLVATQIPKALRPMERKQGRLSAHERGTGRPKWSLPKREILGGCIAMESHYGVIGGIHPTEANYLGAGGRDSAWYSYFCIGKNKPPAPRGPLSIQRGAHTQASSLGSLVAACGDSCTPCA
jgi:hypothetical protein